MLIEPMTRFIGAEVKGINLGDAARSDNLFGAINDALLTYKVLFLRDQKISREEHVAFAKRFGELEDHPVAGSDPDYPGLVRIYKDSDSPKEHYENAWHCDATWREAPPMGCVLRCVETPAVGGDTMWCNMVKAYEELSDDIKVKIDGLKASHSIQSTFGAAMSEDKRKSLKAQYPDAEHPVVRTHPETGEKVLFVNSFTTHFVNYHTPKNIRHGQDFAPGGANLLTYLQGRATIPDYQVRWRWEKDSVAIWDNRCTQHYAVQDYWPAVRKMERAGIIGDKPF